MAIHSASQPTPPKSAFPADEEMVTTPKATPTKRRTSVLSAAETTTEGSAKKAKTGAGTLDGSNAPRFTVVDDSDEDEDDAEASSYLFSGKSLQPHFTRVFEVDTIVAFMNHDGNSLGRRVNALEKWLGHTALPGDSYSAQSNWIVWKVEDKTLKFGKKKLPAYVPLAEDCHAIVSVVKEGWIPELDNDWIRSWVVEFNCDVDDRDAAQMTLIEDKENGYRNRWELRMVGAAECQLLIMQHGNEAEYTIEVGNNNKVEATVKAFTGCAVCWDADSAPGN
ncbi:hypothetical protein V565_276350, partial [Rhizoctonia solani 123E]